ncbi:MAG TPA: hypothetical protein VI072_04950 [Polyangiaceae bacterium]
MAYDFSDAGLGPYSTRALIADDDVIVNQLGRIEIEPDGCLQVIVCEHCGIVHCEPGGWIAARRLGDAVLWMPCFDRIADSDAGPNEYAPPAFVKRRGPLIFTKTTGARLRDLVPLLDAHALPMLTEREACLLMQWQAPGRILGNPGAVPRVRREFVVACDDGRLKEHLDALDALLASAALSNVPVALRHAQTPTVYIDVRGATEWHPIALEPPDHTRLALARDVAIVRANDAA